jgi:glucose-1-phosphate thymidylyltransferase
VGAAETVGLVPAAGKGTRLGLPFPKELCPLPFGASFVPVADVTVGNLVEAGVRSLVLVINHEKAKLVRHFGSGARFGAEIAYVCQETVSEASASAGLGDAIDAAYHLTRGRRVAFGMPDTIVTPAGSTSTGRWPTTRPTSPR